MQAPRQGQLVHGELVHSPLVWWARTRPAHCALSDGQRSLTFAQLHAEVVQRAHALEQAHSPHSLFIDEQQTQLEQLLQFLGIVASGRCAAVGDPDWPPSQREAATDFLAAHNRRVIAGSAQPDSLFYIGFTSGSTGQPKGFCRDHYSWVSSFRACLQAFGNDASLPLIVPGHISHSLFLFGMLLGLWTGAGVVLQERFSAPAVWGHLTNVHTQDHSLVAVPAQLLVMLEYAERRALPALPTVKLVMISGARWPRQHTDALQALFPAAQIIEFYGASELSFVAWTRSHISLPALVVGHPFDGVQIEIRPLPGNAMGGMPDAENDPDSDQAISPGLIWVRSPMLFRQYIGPAGEPENADSSACLRDADGWLSVQDVGYLDAMGRLCLLGRLNRMIVTQARKLFPEELEMLLESHPQIARASVHAINDALRGSLVCAVVNCNLDEPGQRPTAASLAQWCRARLQAYKVPRQWWICNDWSWTTSGKTDHAALARMLRQKDSPCLQALR